MNKYFSAKNLKSFCIISCKWTLGQYSNLKNVTYQYLIYSLIAMFKIYLLIAVIVFTGASGKVVEQIHFIY